VREGWLTAVPKLGFVTALVLLGVYTPEPIARLLVQVAQSIGGQ
jgi:hydrogenase-4 component F